MLFYDRAANQIRSVDPRTNDISVVAGSGTQLNSGPIDTTDPASDVDLPNIVGMWTDTAGDVFAWTCIDPTCDGGHDLYLLSATDGRWQLALSDPQLATQAGFRWEGLAVAPNGDMYGVDTVHDVIDRIAAGSDPHSTGTVVAGTSGTAGTAGDGGPATQATIEPSGPIVVTGAGDIYFADGPLNGTLRHVDPSGTIGTLPDPGASSDGTQWAIHGLTVGSSGSVIYVEYEFGIAQAAIRAVPANGSSPRAVAGPLPTCSSATQGCIGPQIAEVTTGSTTDIVAAVGSIQSWPADGSKPQAYDRYAGVLNDVLGVRSPDGTRLDQAYLDIQSLAVSPTGSIALAAPDGIHLLSGLTPSSTITTLASGVLTTSMQYADDGTLFALVEDPTPHVVSISPAGTVTTLLGGGDTASAVGVSGTDVDLPYAASFAVDAVNDNVFFDDGASNSVWELPSGASTVVDFGSSPVVGGEGGLSVAPDHSVLVGSRSGGLARLQPDGSAQRLCWYECPGSQLQQLTNGLIVGEDQNESGAVLGTDGTVEEIPGPPWNLTTVTPSGMILTAETGGSAQGLLAQSSAALSTPQQVDAPAVQVSPQSGGAALTIAPTVAGQEIIVWGAPADAEGNWVKSPTPYEDVTSDGSAVTYQLQHLLTTFPAPAGSVTPSSYRIEVQTTNFGDATHDTVFDSQVKYVTPTTDSTAPAAPTISLVSGDAHAVLSVGSPSDADLDFVVVCQTGGTTPATDPRTCDDIAEVGPPNPSTVSAYIDTTVATTFTAFAVDDSGNVSTPVSVTRPAPGMVTGEAVSGGYVIPQPSAERVVWQCDSSASIVVKYASGSTPPATPSDGTAGGIDDGGGFYPGSTVACFSDIPVTSGQKVSVSLFSSDNQDFSDYHRTSVVLSAGESSDTVRLSGPAKVAEGARPKLSATLRRDSFSDGTSGLSGQTVALYGRPVGGTWTELTTAPTATSGAATFNPVAPKTTTQYQARYTGPVESLSSATTSTEVEQTVTIKAAASVAVKHPLTVTGTVAPHRGATVHLQRRSGTRWVTVGSARTSAAGTYKIVYRPTVKGKETLRTYVAATAGLLAGQSTTRALDVK